MVEQIVNQTKSTFNLKKAAMGVDRSTRQRHLFAFEPGIAFPEKFHTANMKVFA
jgi:hypothetical protein